MSCKPGDQEAGSARDPAPDRVEPAWRAWLKALASDAEAALGAALAYEALDAEARNAVLDVLEQDAEHAAVPRVAVFAPLLSVEQNAHRCDRIRRAIGNAVDFEAHIPARALMGVADDGDRIVVAETQAYLDFVHLTVCRIEPENCVRWVRCEPLIHARNCMQPGSLIDDTEVEIVPFDAAVDLIARAIVAQRRRDGFLPKSLRPLIELFDARCCESQDFEC